MIQNKKGFTLIELIIVMAIIGILAVVAVIAIGSKSADARDARRLADMAAVRTAMALSCSDGETISLVDGTLAAVATPVLCSATGSSYITFTNLHDPETVAAGCADDILGCAADGVDCDYGFNTNTPTACSYRVNFYQEGLDGAGYASEDGLVE